jgi:hypothetical protein
MTEPVKRGRGRPRKHPLQPIEPSQFEPAHSPVEILPPAVQNVPAKRLNPVDPAMIEPWPRTLPIEIALQTGPIEKLVEAYKISPKDWEVLSCNPDFIAEVEAQREALKTDGMSFKMKARLQAEEMLKTSWRLVHDPDTPAPQKADLIKTTFRVAGYDSKEGIGVGNAVGLSINLILGDK